MVHLLLRKQNKEMSFYPSVQNSIKKEKRGFYAYIRVENAEGNNSFET
jgi:hypothetical protein